MAVIILVLFEISGFLSFLQEENIPKSHPFQKADPVRHAEPAPKTLPAPCQFGLNQTGFEKGVSYEVFPSCPGNLNHEFSNTIGIIGPEVFFYHRGKKLMSSLKFKGKSTVHSLHLGTPFHSLDMDREKSLLPGKAKGKSAKPSLDDNLIIHGDNLHALKALLPRYAGKIKCIYIDPPYNTGNEGWIYNDNVKSPELKDWLKKEVGVDDMERHDKWLCMMWPRLHLLRELLADDGAIFISIDDNEQHRLRMIMDEIFGEEHFVNTIVWRKKAGGGQDSEYLAREHDYILCYRKSNKFSIHFRTTTINPKDFNKIKNERQCRFIKLEKWGSNAYREDRPTMFYPIKDPEGHDFYPKAPDGRDGNWRTRPFNLDKEHIHWEKQKNRWIPFEVKYLDELNGQIKIIKDRTILYNLATTTSATNEQKRIFGQKVFDNSKPVDLLIRLLKIGSDKNAIVLDSFAGSGTTAHAVLELNKEDGGKRKFILVECEDYANKITAERVRRVIKGYPFKGDQKKILLQKKISPQVLKDIKNHDKKDVLDECTRMEAQYKDKYDEIKKECSGDTLRLIGINRVTKKTKGLGGSFTYCSLGEEINTENLIKAKKLPAYDVLARYVFWTATGETLKTLTENQDFYVGKTKNNMAVFMVYKPDKNFLVSNDSALNLSRERAVQKIIKSRNFKKAYVFAMACFVPPEELFRKKITFCQIPFAIHRIVGQ